MYIGITVTPFPQDPMAVSRARRPAGTIAENTGILSGLPIRVNATDYDMTVALGTAAYKSGAWG